MVLTRTKPMSSFLNSLLGRHQIDSIINTVVKEVLIVAVVGTNNNASRSFRDDVAELHVNLSHVRTKDQYI